ncbi:MAG: carboxymuconolactone decarboxylase family protein [Alphaproteobacteria bacterium]
MKFTSSDLRALVHGTSIGAEYEHQVAEAVSAQLSAVLRPGALPTKDKLLLLFATCAARRHHEPAFGFARRALEAGATTGEVEELLLACCVSRGILVYLEGRAALRELFGAGTGAQKPASSQRSGAGARKNTLSKFLSYFGSLPLWVELLAEKQPALIEGHQGIREIVFADGHAKRKIKELAFVCINCADRYDYGISLHAQASAAAGASKEEILEAIALSVIEGGIVSWIEGVRHYLGGKSK